MPMTIIVADRRAHRLQHLDAEAHAVFEAAAIFVGALVDGRAPELVDQMAVRGGQLAAVEPAFLAAARGGGVVGDDARDVEILHLLGDGAAGGLAAGRGGDGRQPVLGVPAGAPAHMGELDHQRGAVARGCGRRIRGRRGSRCHRRRRSGSRARPGCRSRPRRSRRTWSGRCRPWPSPRDRAGSAPSACRPSRRTGAWLVLMIRLRIVRPLIVSGRSSASKGAVILAAFLYPLFSVRLPSGANRQKRDRNSPELRQKQQRVNFRHGASAIFRHRIAQPHPQIFGEGAARKQIVARAIVDLVQDDAAAQDQGLRALTGLETARVQIEAAALGQHVAGIGVRTAAAGRGCR